MTRRSKEKRSTHNQQDDGRLPQSDSLISQSDGFETLRAAFSAPDEGDGQQRSRHESASASASLSPSPDSSCRPDSHASSIHARKGKESPARKKTRAHEQIPPEPPLSRTERRNRERHERHRKMLRILRIVLFALVGIALIAGIGFTVTKVVGRVRAHTQAQQGEQTQTTPDWPGPGYGSVEFTIATGESGTSVARRLARMKIVASPDAFMNAVVSADAAEKIKPGTFTLKYRMNAADVVTVVTDSRQAKGLIEVTADERVGQVIDNVAAVSKKISKSDLTAVLTSKGEGILPPEAKGSFEGWLEPGSYDPSSYTTARQLVTDMVKKRVAALNTLGVPTGDQRERVLTIASIIGGEVNRQEYYGKVSRVIANRLDHGMPLGMDSVLAYGNNVRPSQITQSMIDNASNPYNSRVRKGLPPTPINQPDRAMIEAALHPDKGDWLYFVTVNLNTGETKFTADEAQFQQYSKEYRKWAATNQ